MSSFLQNISKRKFFCKSSKSEKIQNTSPKQQHPKNRGGCIRKFGESEQARFEQQPDPNAAQI